MCWRKSSDTASLDTGPLQVSRFSGLAEEPTLLNAVPWLSALRARAVSGSGRLNEPLTRWPVAVLDGSATLSSASPAVEITFAVPVASYVLSRPGVKLPKLGAVLPSVRLNVAGTLPPTPPSAVPVYVTFAPSQLPQQMPSGVPVIVPSNFSVSMPRL